MAVMLLEALSALPDVVVSIAVVVVVATVCLWLSRVAINRFVRLATERRRDRWERFGRPGQIIAQATRIDDDRAAARARTIGSMLRSTASVVVVSVAVLTVLGQLGVNLAPVLTTAGVGGVALAFGAQSLVKDVISGVFLVAEDQFGVGDQVTIGDVSGTVEEVALRVTSVRDGDGRLWYLRNGEITKVANVSQGWSMATADVLVAPDADVARALAALEVACDDAWADESLAQNLVERPSVLGVERVGVDSMTLRISAKCLANQQWGVQRALLARAVQVLDAAGVVRPAALPSGPRPSQS